MKIAITPPRIARLRSNLAQCLSVPKPVYYMFKVKGHRSRSRGKISTSQRNVAYQHEKRSKMAMDRLSDLKLGTSDEIKADRDCAASGCAAAMQARSSYEQLSVRLSIRPSVCLSNA